MNKNELVKRAYEGYLEMAEDEEKIIIDLNGFDYCEECKTEDGELDLDLTSELNQMLIEMFKTNGYDVYTAGDTYAEDGQFKNVVADTAVAIKE